METRPMQKSEMIRLREGDPVILRIGRDTYTRGTVHGDARSHMPPRARAGQHGKRRGELRPVRGAGQFKPIEVEVLVVFQRNGKMEYGYVTTLNAGMLRVERSV